MDISKALRQIRENTALNQKEFAARTGLTQTYVSLIENGKRVPSLEVIGQYESIGKVPLAVIMWKSLTEKDVQKNKLKVFKELKPVVDNLINQMFN